MIEMVDDVDNGASLRDRAVVNGAARVSALRASVPSAAHTAGPWLLSTVRTSSGLCHKVGPFPWSEGRANHACIYVDHPDGGAIDQELEANARLISAAPDLLAALRHLLDGALSLPRFAEEEGRAAIAKALGQ